MTTVEAARVSTAAQEPQGDDRKVSALVWIVPMFVAWVAFFAWVFA